MKIVHLETMRLIHKTIIRPSGSCGNCGSHNGVLWQGVMLTHNQARDARKVRQAWNAANPGLMAVSVNAPVIAAQTA